MKIELIPTGILKSIVENVMKKGADEVFFVDGSVLPLSRVIAEIEVREFRRNVHKPVEEKRKGGRL